MRATGGRCLSILINCDGTLLYVATDLAVPESVAWYLDNLSTEQFLLADGFHSANVAASMSEPGFVETWNTGVAEAVRQPAARSVLCISELQDAGLKAKVAAAAAINPGAWGLRCRPMAFRGMPAISSDWFARSGHRYYSSQS